MPGQFLSWRAHLRAPKNSRPHLRHVSAWAVVSWCWWGAVHLLLWSVGSVVRPWLARWSAMSFPGELEWPLIHRSVSGRFWLICLKSCRQWVAKAKFVWGSALPVVMSAAYWESYTISAGRVDSPGASSSSHIKASAIAVSSPVLLLYCSAPRKRWSVSSSMTGPKSRNKQLRSKLSVAS